MSSGDRSYFLNRFSSALHEGVGAVFVGAGVSKAANYPTWAELLAEIGDELGVASNDTQDLAALAQWHITKTGSANRVLDVIKREIGKDLPVPPSVEVLARLPVRHIWTTNYDRLVERAFDAIRRPIDVVSGAGDLPARPKPGAARLYKMHGSIDRLDDIVISTEHYELYRSKRGAFLPLLQAHMTSKSVLFIGLSLTDPNIRHVLSLVRESFADLKPEHFAIVKAPDRKDGDSDEAFKARKAQHAYWAKDLDRYGLRTIEVDTYDDIPVLLAELERRVAQKRVWVSGSWPIDSADATSADLHDLAENIGRLVGTSGRDLVSGSGLLVGSAAIAGFIEALRTDGGWDLDRRLIVRPFPQPVGDAEPDREQWAGLRADMARYAGVVVFLGGAKMEKDGPVDADGVLQEFEAAKAAGAFLLPIGAFGGAALTISQGLLGSELPSEGPDARRPTDEELSYLSSPEAKAGDHLKKVGVILKRLTRV